MAASLDQIEWRVSPGLTDYGQALAEMEARATAIREGRARELIWLLQHPPLLTAGTSAVATDLIDPDRFPVYRAGRGGSLYLSWAGPARRLCPA
jgi:lipoyl(octanoyl) transferase